MWGYVNVMFREMPIGYALGEDLYKRLSSQC